MAATATSSHTCSGGSCSIHHHKAAPAKKPTTYKVRPALKSVPHRHHAPCSDPSCDIKHPHSHIKLVKPKSDCGHNHAPGESCGHSHKPKPKLKKPISTLEQKIISSKFSKPLKSFLANTSFLTSAFIPAEMLPASDATPYASIGIMHLVNRSFTKLPRLMLSGILVGASQAAQKMGLNKTLVRTLATAGIAFVEKFSGNSKAKSKSELTNIIANASDATKWKEFVPSLLNIEAKVQGLFPVIDKLFKGVEESMPKIVTVPLKSLALAGSFTGFDQILSKLGKQMGSEALASAGGSALCGCCGSPVCTAAVVDTAAVSGL